MASVTLLADRGDFTITGGDAYLIYSGESTVDLSIDWANYLIKVGQPTTSVDAQVLHDFIEDAMATPRGLYYEDILKPEGKIEDPVNPGVYSQIILILNQPWQIQFWQGSGYTRIYGGKLVGGLQDQPIKATGNANDVTILESPVDGLAIAGGSEDLTQASIQAIVDAVWAAPIEDHQDAGSTGEALSRASARRGVYTY